MGKGKKHNKKKKAGDGLRLGATSSSSSTKNKENKNSPRIEGYQAQKQAKQQFRANIQGRWGPSEAAAPAPPVSSYGSLACGPPFAPKTQKSLEDNLPKQIDDKTAWSTVVAKKKNATSSPFTSPLASVSPLASPLASVSLNHSNLHQNRPSSATNWSKQQPVLITADTKHTTRSVQPKKVQQQHKELLFYRLSTKEQAEILKEACLKQGSLFRERFGEMGLKCDFELCIDSSAVKGTGGTTSSYGLVLTTPEPLHHRESGRMRAIFASYHKVGFLEWLAGAKGWRFEQQTCSQGGTIKWKQSVLNKLNCLQDLFRIFAPDEQKYMFLGGKKFTWRKAAELQVCVSDIRMWLETLEQTPLVKKLLRTSHRGPDTCVHWAHHHPLNRYPLTVVTQESMTELINGVIQIFREQFQCPTTGIPLGTRWRLLPPKEKRKTEWEPANNSDPNWTKERFVNLLNGKEKLTINE